MSGANRAGAECAGCQRGAGGRRAWAEGGRQGAARRGSTVAWGRRGTRAHPLSPSGAQSVTFHGSSSIRRQYTCASRRFPWVGSVESNTRDSRRPAREPAPGPDPRRGTRPGFVLQHRARVRGRLAAPAVVAHFVCCRRRPSAARRASLRRAPGDQNRAGGRRARPARTLGARHTREGAVGDCALGRWGSERAARLRRPDGRAARSRYRAAGGVPVRPLGVG